MKKKLPLYELTVDALGEGVTYTALVDSPAIESNWMAFADEFLKPHQGEAKDDFMKRCIPAMINEGKEQDQAVAMCSSMYGQYRSAFKVANEERRIITGAAMIPDIPIYRRDESRGEYNVVFSKETIEKIVKKWAKQGNYNNVNLMHQEGTDPAGVYLIESFVTDKERGVVAPKVLGDMPEGTWIQSYYVESDSVWASVKNGTFRGFSVEGDFGISEKFTKKESIDELLYELAKSL